MNKTIIEKKACLDFLDNPIPVNYEEIPELTGEDYEERLQKLFSMPEAEAYDAFVIYGDREHFSNIHYFTGYDPRWEESLLIMKRSGERTLLVGNEGISYVKKVEIEVNIALYQTFSLMGQPNESSATLREIFESCGFDRDGKIGIIGFKKYDRRKHDIDGLISDVPYYIIETLVQAVGKNRLENATDLMADCEYGLKHCISAKEAVIFEEAGTKISRGIYDCIRKLKPGMTELEAASCCGFDGSPANMHPNVNFGETHVALGLNSPDGYQKLNYGDPIGLGYGLRGSLVHKCGMYIRDANDLKAGREHYVEQFLKSYFNNVASWYEMLKIGTSCGDIYAMTDTELGLKKYGCTLNPGHLTHTEEWTNSPFYKDSRVKLKSGMALQCDYTVTWQKPFMSAHIEDGLIIADDNLMEEVRRISAGCYERIIRRKQFIREVLNINLPREVLPLSDLTLVCFPYMADTQTVLARK